MKILNTKKNKDNQDVYEVSFLKKEVTVKEVTVPEIDEIKKRLEAKIVKINESITEMQELLAVKESELEEILKLEELITK